MRDKNSKLSLWISTFISIVCMFFIVLIAYIAEKVFNTNNLSNNILTLISVIIALIPPILWMGLFYKQDRLNPEPKGLVFKTLILGALVHKAIYVPIVSMILPSGNTGFESIGNKMITTIILVAVIQESIKMLTVRYSIYPSKEFDEDIDGIIYGSALGLGFATMSSIDAILSAGGAMLTNATVLVVVQTFSHASITGLSCYFLGVSKNAKFNILRLPTALLLSSSINAIIQFLLDAVVRKGFKVNYIIGLLPAAIVALIVFGFLVAISSRHAKEGGSKPNGTIDTKKAISGIVPVWILFALTLVIGITFTNNALKNKTITVDDYIEIQYPNKWVENENEADLFKASDIMKDAGLNSITVKKLPLTDLMSIEIESEEERLQSATAAWSIRSGINYRFYQAENCYYLDAKGKETYIINYYYISSGSDNKPNIGYASDILSVSGDNLYIITISSSYESFVINDNKFINVDYSFNYN